ncbi:ArsR family transcriptional regulator [Microbacterium sp. cx-55]|uniref:helix-turn-helix transcriptional regulator n=1 Tax=unclassified Microbacterium TaxID=2609290 RepID=UPI001CC19A12|nr:MULTISPECIES: ArsR family transcriptional regulator [unclassified Microbacterium]MBZ4487970.1 ArsR family transcriptional regulator [Microbacterium sp. cx-55]MCC4908994.1 ArsR family transcriptional regulator [Microbacterium sp. cx-59]UGB34620.1 ArsR family transcriptional regulator [Microbacterium sp. cx-55]
MTTAPYNAISSYSRVKILQSLQVRGQRTIADLCAATDLHPNTVREHLQRLINGGYVITETEHRTTRGRPRTLYSAATGAHRVSPIAQRKAREAAQRGDLMRRVMPWTDDADADLPTSAVHQIDALVEDLVEAGFDPAVDERTLTVDISPCPHASAEPTHRETLCAVHLGLMNSVLAQADGPLRVDAMAASCDPKQCIVRLMLAERAATSTRLPVAV